MGRAEKRRKQKTEKVWVFGFKNDSLSHKIGQIRAVVKKENPLLIYFQVELILNLPGEYFENIWSDRPLVVL